MGGELNRGRCYQHDRVQTAVNVLAYWQRLQLFVERSLSKVVSTCSLVYMIYPTMKMQSVLKIKFLMSAIYHQSIRCVYYDDSLFLFYALLWVPMFHHSVWSVIIVDSRYSVEA